MKKLLSLTVASLFLLSVAGWDFSSKDLNGVNANKSVKSTISSTDNTKLLSYASTSAQASLNAPKTKKAVKKPAKKVIQKSTTVTKKTIHKKGNTTTTTITTKTTKHK